MKVELWKRNKFRVCPIVKVVDVNHYKDSFELVTKQLDYKDGLAVECLLDDKSYYVIAFVRPNKDGVCSYESVGDRIEESCNDWNDTLMFREALKFAFENISSCWREGL